MNRVYLDIAPTFLPKATIVIDRFHVIRYVTWALENVRKRVQKDMLPSKRRYFKRSRHILLSHRSHLSEENQLALEVMLQQSEDLAKAYYLKELFYHFMASETSQIAKKRLHTFLLAAQNSDLEEFNAILTMLANWEKYILNAFDCPYTSGILLASTWQKIRCIFTHLILLTILNLPPYLTKSRGISYKKSHLHLYISNYFMHLF